MAILFNHDIYHEGAALQNQLTSKFIVKTELIFRRLPGIRDDYKESEDYKKGLIPFSSPDQLGSFQFGSVQSSSLSPLSTQSISVRSHVSCQLQDQFFWFNSAPPLSTQVSPVPVQFAQPCPIHSIYVSSNSSPTRIHFTSNPAPASLGLNSDFLLGA